MNRKCKNPTCNKYVVVNPNNKNSVRRMYCCPECKGEHYRSTHREYYRQMSGKYNGHKVDGIRYAEINGRISYIPKAEREKREYAKTLKGLRETFLDTESCDQGAYL